MSQTEEHKHGGGEGRHGDHGHGGKDKDEIILEVATPKGPWTGAFAKTTKVSAVIEAIVEDLHLEPESFQLVLNGSPLEPTDRTLVSFGLKGKVKLALVATGSGV